MKPFCSTVGGGKDRQQHPHYIISTYLTAKDTLSTFLRSKIQFDSCCNSTLHFIMSNIIEQDEDLRRAQEIGMLLRKSQRHPSRASPRGTATPRTAGPSMLRHVTTSPASPAVNNRQNIGRSSGRVEKSRKLLRQSTGAMRSHTPSGDPPGRRASVTNRFRNSTGGSALPRPHTSLRESRVRLVASSKQKQRQTLAR